MHIFENFKKGALVAPHELTNPKKAKDLDQPKINGTAFKKVGQKRSKIDLEGSNLRILNKQQAVKVKVSKGSSLRLEELKVEQV